MNMRVAGQLELQLAVAASRRTGTVVRKVRSYPLALVAYSVHSLVNTRVTGVTAGITS
jgi:hypothetical protein